MASHSHRPIVLAENASLVAPKQLLATIPAFELDADPDADTALILAEYEVNNTANVTFEVPVSRALQKMKSFFVCVRFVNEDGDVVRYVLHRPKASARLFFPDYSAHTIGANAVIEIWSHLGYDTATTGGKDLVIVINDMVYYTGNDTRFMPTVDNVEVTLTPTAFVSTPTGDSNPFADNALLTS